MKQSEQPALSVSAETRGRTTEGVGSAHPPNYVARLTKWFRDGTRPNGIAWACFPARAPRFCAGDESDAAELHNRGAKGSAGWVSWAAGIFSWAGVNLGIFECSCWTGLLVGGTYCSTLSTDLTYSYLKGKRFSGQQLSTLFWWQKGLEY